MRPRYSSTRKAESERAEITTSKGTNMDEIKTLDIDMVSSNDVLKDLSEIIQSSQQVVFRTVDLVLLKRNWMIGKRIYEEELKETRKENYGKEIIKSLSIELTERFGNGFKTVNLYNYLRFYKLYKNIFQSVTEKSLLSWTHYSLLIIIGDENARNWYEQEAIKCSWSVRTLQRNIHTQYYYRLLSSQIDEASIKSIPDQDVEERLKRLEHVKNPSVLEFINPQSSNIHLEKNLRKVIVRHIQTVMMELGKGYAFIGEEYRIKTIDGEYYIDLVFYNYILKCFVLVDLKMHKINHKDVGQMDMYIRMFDDLMKTDSDSPTMGIILCADTNSDIAKYSVMADSNQLFASKYKLYLPNEDELKAEIEYQKELYYLNYGK